MIATKSACLGGDSRGRIHLDRAGYDSKLHRKTRKFEKGSTVEPENVLWSWAEIFPVPLKNLGQRNFPGLNIHDYLSPYHRNSRQWEHSNGMKGCGSSRLRHKTGQQRTLDRSQGLPRSTCGREDILSHHRPANRAENESATNRVVQGAQTTAKCIRGSSSAITA